MQQQPTDYTLDKGGKDKELSDRLRKWLEEGIETEGNKAKIRYSKRSHKPLYKDL